jgi:hypothetical protein
MGGRRRSLWVPVVAAGLRVLTERPERRPATNAEEATPQQTNVPQTNALNNNAPQTNAGSHNARFWPRIEREVTPRWSFRPAC